MVPYSKKHHKVLLSQDIPAKWKSSAIANSKILYGQTEGTESLLQFLNLPEYSMYFTKLYAFTNEKLTFIRERPVFFLMIQLTNTLDFTIPGMQPLRLLEWSFNFYYAPDFELEVDMKENASYETFFLIVPEAFVLYFAKSFEMIRTFHKKTKEKLPVVLLPSPKICSAQIMQKITEVKRTGMQDLTIQFADDMLTEILDSSVSLPYRRMQYDDEIIERLYAMKAFLEENPRMNMVRGELMEQFDLTLQQFNQGFASIYNLSPFSFLKYLRKQDHLL